jgi:5'-nucleotidase
MKRPHVYLDLDGVMADFDWHFPATFGIDHRSMADDAMWAMINAHPSYFRDMPIFDGAKNFFDRISWMNPIILTACPKSNYAHVARQKREWVREHLSTSCHILPVMGGGNKPLFMHSRGDILIDDFERNTKSWQMEGGFAILHRDFKTTRDELEREMVRSAAA